MLITNMREIGNKLFYIRKKKGLTQAEVAEKANLSDRAYADIERGTSNMRAETMISICNALHITPDEVFVEADSPVLLNQDEILKRLSECSAKEKETALSLLEIYLRSLDK